MHDLQAAGDLLEVAQRIGLQNAAQQAALQIPAREIFHGQEFATGIDSIVVDRDDGRIAQRRQGRVFARKDLLAVGIIVLALGDLQCHIAGQLFAARQVHERFVGFADGLADGIAGYRVAQRAGRGGGVGGFLHEFGVLRGVQLDATQGEFHRGAQPIRIHQPLRQIVDGTQLQRPHRRQFIAVLRDRDDGGKLGAVAQQAQPLEAFGMRILGAVAKLGDEHDQVEFLACQGFHARFEFARVDRGDGAVRKQHAEVIAQPLAVARIAIDNQQAGVHGSGGIYL